MFTFRDAAALQRRLVGAPSLALHQALLHPERDLEGVAPGWVARCWVGQAVPEVAVVLG